jgi:hypothetical protein
MAWMDDDTSACCVAIKRKHEQERLGVVAFHKAFSLFTQPRADFLNNNLNPTRRHFLNMLSMSERICSYTERQCSRLVVGSSGYMLLENHHCDSSHR